VLNHLVNKQDKCVTIGIPTFSRLELLIEAVASALAQSYPHCEVIVSDDGNSAAIAEWACEMQKHTEGRFRYWRNERNHGLAGNWNVIADRADGDYLVIIGDDDRLEPNFVSTLMQGISQGVAVSFCNQHIINEKGERMPRESRRYTEEYHRSELPAGELTDPRKAVWQNSVPMSAALMRTNLVRRLRFKEDLNTPEIELFARLANEAHRFYFCPEYLAEYRVHGRSETSAGLRSESLARYLLDIPVPSELEPTKQVALAPLMFYGVGRALAKGDFALAKRLFRSEYFPAQSRRSLRGLFYRLELSLPAPLATMLWRVAARSKPLGNILPARFVAKHAIYDAKVRQSFQ
jgi:glycosyltransferase involved in cell wall biosynthesis